MAVPHAVAATGSVKFGGEHSGQGDFVKLNRVHFENLDYAGRQSGNAPVRGASAPNCQATVSKVDVV